MKKNYLFLVALLAMNAFCFAQTISINEIHYDNTGGDIGEGFEVAGSAGLDLSGYKVLLYNGSNSTVYSTVNLSGIFTDETNGLGFIWFDAAGIQNGSPDGLALIDPSNNVLQFLSYEGVITAVDGTASGLTSTDIGVSQSSSTPVGETLQYNGSSWVGPLANTKGAATVGQTTLSIRENQIEGFAMYPNPVINGKFTISSAQALEKNVQIFSIIGRQVYNKRVNANEMIDVSNLTTGFYLVRVEEEGNTTTRKLMIQ